MTNIFQTLRDRITSTRSHLCIGIDPFLKPEDLPNWLGAKNPLYLLQFQGQALVEAARRRVPAVKFQSAFFEACGAPGLEILAKLIQDAHRADLRVILDAKRGDISSTMAAYGRAAFDYLQADILTVTPYLGMDVVRALTPWLDRDKGIYIVWASSNPSAKDLQEVVVATNQTVQEQLLGIIKHDLDPCIAPAIGLVLGATRLAMMSAPLKARCSQWPLLLPGVGEQGGKVDDDLKQILRNSPASLVPLSRAIAGIHALPGENPILNESSYIETVVQRVQKWATVLQIDHL